jgi:hypothetical protein
MFRVAQEKLNLEQQVTGGGNGKDYMIIFMNTLFNFNYYFDADDEEADKKTMAQLLKQSLGIDDVLS